MKAVKLQEQWSFLHLSSEELVLKGQATDCWTLTAVTLIVAHTEGGIGDTLLFANRVEYY